MKIFFESFKRKLSGAETSMMAGNARNNQDKKFPPLEKDFVLKLEGNRMNVLNDLNDILSCSGRVITTEDEQMICDDDDMMNEFDLANPIGPLLDMAEKSLETFSEDLTRTKTKIAALLQEEDKTDQSIFDSQYAEELSTSQMLLQVHRVLQQFELWVDEMLEKMIQNLIMREELKKVLNSDSNIGPKSDLFKSFGLLDNKMESQCKSIISSTVMNYQAVILVLKDFMRDVEEVVNEDHPELNLYM